MQRSLLKAFILTIIVVSNVVTIAIVNPAFSADFPPKEIEEVRFKSSDQQTVMIELFTSQGCSSCPPAEKYLNSFVDHPDLWKKYIPVEFHVDYWDYIGWKDMFAKPQHGIRHRKYAGKRHVRGVYTPTFMVNGKAWRKTFFQKDPSVAVKSVGILDVLIIKKMVVAKFKPSTDTKSNLVFNFVVLGLGIETKIKAGEREGRTSHHEFVVLSHKTQKSNNNQWRLELPDLSKLTGKLSNKPKRLAVAAWVSKQDDPTPIQATGGYLQ